MTTALLYKEFRETLPIVVLALACLLLVSASSSDLRTAPGFLRERQDAIPFLSDQFVTRLGLVGGLAALAMGFWQMLGDFRGDTQLFLLHRPVKRTRIYSIKLATGVTLLLMCMAAAILLHAFWAALPGTHASPFAWSMTERAWRTGLSIPVLYFGAALCAIYPGAWVGTRLAPLAAVGAIYFLLSVLPTLTVVQLIAYAVMDILLCIAIFHVVKTRDFA